MINIKPRNRNLELYKNPQINMHFEITINELLSSHFAALNSADTA